jgi:hypothetical protein
MAVAVTYEYQFCTFCFTPNMRSAQCRNFLPPSQPCIDCCTELVYMQCWPQCRPGALCRKRALLWLFLLNYRQRHAFEQAEMVFTDGLRSIRGTQSQEEKGCHVL